MSDRPAATSYDETPYTSHPLPETHPDRLATMATLLGLSPPAVETCRVLELGCGDGGNLLPMAAQLPGARFIGIDASTVQIEDGCRAAEATGLTNIELRTGDILALGPELGEFDYIITHGVYSWVPPAVQEKILEISARNLRPNGIAYVSYNTNPGWRVRGIARDLLDFGTRGIRDHGQRVSQARSMLDAICGIMPENSLHGRILQLAQEHLSGKQDYYLLHEYLEDDNVPVYFHEFCDGAARHGLQYLVESDSLDSSRSLSPQAREVLSRFSSNVIDAEQYADFVTGQMFRRSLLCLADVAVTRPADPKSLFGLHLMTPLRADVPDADLRTSEPVRFSHEKVSLTTGAPLLKATLQCLGESWPRPVPMVELIAAARQRLERSPADESPAHAEERHALAGAMLHCFEERHVGLRPRAIPMATRPGRKPIVSPLARWQAAGMRHIANQLHEVTVIDSMQRYLLPLLDGTHDRNALLDRLAGDVVNGTLDLNQGDRPVTDAETARRLMAPALDDSIRRLASAMLLQPDEGGEFHENA